MNDGTVTPRNLPRGERRKQLLDCAVCVAARNGLVRTVHADVAREAGVAVPTVFQYFRNRRNLMLAIIEEVDRFYTELGLGFHSGAVAPLEAVRGHLRGFSESVASNPEYARIWLEWGALTRNEDGLWDAFLDFQERIIRMLAKSIRQAKRDGTLRAELPASDAARLIVASAYTVAQLTFMRRGKNVLRRYIEQTLHLALMDVTRPSEAPVARARRR